MLIGILNGALEFDAARAAYALIGDTMGQFVLSLGIKRIASEDQIKANQLSKKIVGFDELIKNYNISCKNEGFNLIEWLGKPDNYKSINTNDVEIGFMRLKLLVQEVKVQKVE
ncbi:MAG: hypothetical protein LBI69_04995 [Puniceicoccales bacterium]|jgi:hypothetical protein|nr:hypothetical protein [Puniceicoccales bacterium]